MEKTTRNPSRYFKDILAWQFAHQFVLQVYIVCKTFPPNEQFGLVSQFQRAAVSIAANIAEGYRKLSKAALRNADTTFCWRLIWAI